MAKIHPFKAIRPVRDKVHLVATRPYYTYEKSVLKAKLASNPYTFLRIINPEFDLPPKERKTKDLNSRFELVKTKYEDFIQRGILVQDAEECFYLYRQSGENFSYTGVIAGASVEDYLADNIKKHEATLTTREEMFVEYLDIVTCNAEPVLLCHPAADELQELYRKVLKSRPEYEFTTTDCIKHELWLIDPETGKAIQNHFGGLEAIYIADGHHRSASSTGLYLRRKNESRNHPNDAYFLAFIIDERQLNIFEYNRLIKLKSSQDIKAITDQIQAHFNTQILPAVRTPKQFGEVIMVTSNQVLSVELRPCAERNPVSVLDTAQLTEQILNPIFGISDLKTDKNIDFLPGIEPVETIREKMKTKGCDVAFLLHPLSIEQVKEVADAGLTMPPKSTWVEPKLRSGLTIYNLNE